MRLTKADKNAFVARVMADVPSIDFAQIVQDEVANKCERQLPREVKALLGTSLDGYVARFNVSAYVSVPTDDEDVDEYLFRAYAVGQNEDEVCDVLKEVASQYVTARKQQEDSLAELKHNLRNYVNACSTVERLETVLPEFIRYIIKPTDVETANFPVASNLITDFMRAGWPKAQRVSHTGEAQ
jgi:hypothetical protein